MNKKTILPLIFSLIFSSIATSGTKKVVSTNADAGDGSLRSIVALAGNNDTIVLNKTQWTNDTIKLESPIVFDKNITVVVQGNKAILSGQNKTNIFYVGKNGVDYLVNASFYDLQFVNGFYDKEGAAIYSSGNVTVVRSIFKDNVSDHNDLTYSGSGFGGAIASHSPNGTLSVISSQFENNTSHNLRYGGRGGAIYIRSGNFVSISSTYVNNSAKKGIYTDYLQVQDWNGYGGAIAINPNGIADITANVFQNNSASSVYATDIFFEQTNRLTSHGYNVYSGTIGDREEENNIWISTDKKFTNPVIKENDNYIVNVVSGNPTIRRIPANVKILGVKLPENDITNTKIDYTKPTHSGANQNASQLFIAVTQTPNGKITPIATTATAADSIYVPSLTEKEKIVFNATPNDNYKLSKWIINGANYPSTEKTIKLKTSEIFSVKAVFSKDYPEINYPYIVDFESGIPFWWEQEKTVFNINWLSRTIDSTSVLAKDHSGLKTAYFYQTSSGPDGTPASTTLFTQPLDLVKSIVNPTLSFNYALPGRTLYGKRSNDSLFVYYRTSETDSWKIVPQGIFGAETNTWANVKLNLPEASSTYYVAFKAKSEKGWSYGVLLDDVIIDGTSLKDNVIQQFTGVETNKNLKFSVINPIVNNRLTIFSDNSFESAELYNLQGQKLLTLKLKENTTTTDVSNIPNGLYILRSGNISVSVLKK